MNVLMISIGDNILSNPVGGSLDRQKAYAEALGYIDMIVYSPRSNNLHEKHYDNISIYPTKSLNMLTFVFDVLKIVKKLTKLKKIDVITCQDPFGTALSGSLIKKKYNIPLHIQSHSCFLDNKLWIKEKPLLFSIFNKLSYFTLKNADRLRVVNNEEKKRYINILGINGHNIDVAPVPIDIEFWQEKPSENEKKLFCQKYNIDINKPIVSWAGRPVKFKNLPYLFRSVSLVNKKEEVTFLIAGNMNNSYDDLKILESEFKVKPIYLGLLSHSELKVMYYISDLYLHTSNYEGFGLVVSDAQACGTVVISRKTAGTSDIIDNNKSGYLIDGDEDMFSLKIFDVLSNQDKLHEMSLYSGKMIKNKFNKKCMFDDIILSIKRTQVDLF